MKIQSFYTKILFICLLAYSQIIISQDQGVYIENTMIAIPASGNTTSGDLNFITPCSTFKVNQGKIWLKIDLGEQFEFGSNTAGVPFDINVNVDLSLITDLGTNPTINFDLNLTNKKPESVIYLDLNQYLDDANTGTGLSYLTESISGIKATINNALDNTGGIDLQTNLKIGLYYEIGYGIDVSTNTVSFVSNAANTANKVIEFEWSDTCDAPNYEFQLLRLYNKDEAFITDEHHIKTNVDWSKALSFQTYNSEKQLSISIGEGQGFYVWRVRPIGTFYENGAGNNQNWGNWNTSIYDADNYEFSLPTGNTETFFFEDLDDNTNYQYSRVFTEGNKISEQVTYATTLNQIKQTQRYFPSKDYKIVSQTILDKSGRPTLTTLPIPIEGEKISKYKNNFVTTNGELYRAKHFDEATNYQQPALIDASDAFAYYSSLNGDKRIPNAEGYPFTRVIFSNDGTDRVVEQSGVGKTHMIGDQASGQGRTVRTLYGTPTEEEIVALFGDEAPNHENTVKVITIDPNNTKSVAYITKDGNTIATGLTFSEDDAILDKIMTGPTVSGKTDKITNNIRTAEGFKSSKRITILQDNTEINLSYTISKPVLEGLCNNLEIDLDYKLQIQVFDVNTGNIVDGYDFNEPSIATLGASGAPEVTIDFGLVSLNIGSYYIQKTLIPADDVTAKLVTSGENMKRLIEPYFGWLVDALQEIDCEEEMQFLYNDIFFYGQKIYNQQLSDNNGELVFDCDGCSNITTTFLSKDATNPDAPDEFLDFYTGREDQYGISIIYYDSNNNLQTIDYATATSLGDIKPIEVQFRTPCCAFDIPIVFTPPFRKPSPDALLAYKNDAVADSQLNNSTDYYTLSNNPIKPNNHFLTDTDQNFKYTETDDGNGGITVTIDNRDAYPIDFEGYAISMLYQCKNSADPSYTIDNASDDVYNSMRGWHEPGLLNQMVYHMATDSHGANNCTNRIDGTGAGGNTDSGNTSGNTTPPENGYHFCDIGDTPVYLANAQYSIKELAECWEPIVIELVNRLCVEGLQADIDQNSNVASNVDDQDPAIFKDHFNKNIKNFIVRWISKRKLRRKLRKKNAGTTNEIKDEVAKLSGNLVKNFLDCTGYGFADVLDPDSPTNNFTEFVNDFDGDVSNGEYNAERLLEDPVTEIGKYWAYFNVRPPGSTNTDPDYIIPTILPIDDDEETTNIIKDIFPNLQDPVYAYKYYTYRDGKYLNLEAQTCYRNPNICKNPVTGVEEPCCGGTVENPVPCNFCGIGYITCPYTRVDWSCDQRFTFYSMIKNRTEVTETEGAIVNCENYYEATEYVINPDFEKLLLADGSNSGDFVLQYMNNPTGEVPPPSSPPLDVFTDLPFLSRSLIETYVSNKTFEDLEALDSVELNDINGNVQTTGVSIIENDAYATQIECTDNCDERRDEFREELIKAFRDRCYEIGECKITPDDNIVPIEDIDAMVDKIVEQCKLQCATTTYACTDEPCRLVTKPITEYGGSPEASSDFNTSYIDFGVSGPVITSNRIGQTLIINDPVTGVITDTGETVSVSNVSATGLLEKYAYTSTPSIWDIRRSLTYAEYSRWIQAMEWKIELDIPSKCDALGNYNPNLTYDTDGFPQEPVYVLNDDNDWVIQIFVPGDSPYITRGNPGGPGDTFLDRNEYIKTNTTPVTPGDPQLNDPVNSPKVKIKHQVNN